MRMFGYPHPDALPLCGRGGHYLFGCVSIRRYTWRTACFPHARQRSDYSFPLSRTARDGRGEGGMEYSRSVGFPARRGPGDTP